MGKLLSVMYRWRWMYKVSLLVANVLLSLRFGVFYVIFRLIPITRNKIVFTTYHGKGFGDNAKYIAQELLRQNKDYQLVWSVKKSLLQRHGLPAGIRAVKYGSLREIFELATAKMWIDNARKPYFLCKRKIQFYIQTWHGSIGVKMIEKDAEDGLPWIYIKTAKADSAMSDLYIANGKHIQNLYRNSFWYEGEILMAGCPRNDIFFKDNSHLRHQICSYFGFSSETKILLYAPTFRQDRKDEKWDIDFDACLDALSARWGGTWKVLMRLHPNRASQPLGVSNPNVINASLYDDMQELLAVSDVLVTDYSSSIFEFTLQRKPAFLFTPDIEDYLRERGFYFDLASLPFPQSLSNGQLIDQITKFDDFAYGEDLDVFFREQEICDDGNASKRVVKRINQEIGY